MPVPKPRPRTYGITTVNRNIMSPNTVKPPPRSKILSSTTTAKDTVSTVSGETTALKDSSPSNVIAKNNVVEVKQKPQSTESNAGTTIKSWRSRSHT